MIAMIIGWAAMLIFTFHACTHMVAAGDTWVAMACGRHFVNHGVNTVEPFSVNSHKPGPTPEEVKTWPAWARWITDKVGLKTVRYWHPTGWVNQNWLTHVIFYRLTTALGSEAEPYYDALVLWKFGIYLLAAVALYFTARIYGVHRALAFIAVCFAMYIGRSFFDVRPAGFSNLLVAVLILVLALASHRNALYIWLIVPLIVFWSNVHGGYVYAFIVLVPFVAWHLIANLPRRWAITAYSVLTWLFLSAVAEGIAVEKTDWQIFFVVVAAGIALVMAWHRRVSDAAVAGYCVTASCIVLLVLLTRLFPARPAGLSQDMWDLLTERLHRARLDLIGIFSFAMLGGTVLALLKEKMARGMSMRGTLHTMAAGAVAFVAMVIINPFHLTNLTHTFVISVSKHAERWRDVHEWHRAFDWSNPVGTAKPFLVMYILAWLALIVWVVVSVWMSRAVHQPGKKRSKASLDYAWPKIDLALVAIAALTIYMAIRSRRFIPIAGFAACPLVALLVDQTVRMIAAATQSYRTGKFEAPVLPSSLRWGGIGAGAFAVAVFGLVWGLRFKHVYLDYWPADTKLTSIFMRLTASDAKPFQACEFIRRNKLSGNMFNYWTEGGFIAWGQDPDPKTGRIPLQLFMDGRAQAAYTVAAFDRWTAIMSGGPEVRRALTTRGRMTVNDYIEAGNWISAELRKHDVWAVLMPNNQFDKPFTVSLEYSRDWRAVFVTDKQKLFVDVTSPKGLQIYQAMLTGKAVYPDEYSADLALGYNLLMFPDTAQKKKGLDLIVRAFNSSPSPAPVIEMFRAAQYADLGPRVDQVCEQYVQAFEKNKKVYAGQDGYNLRLEAARLALARLAQAAKANGDSKLESDCQAQMKRYRAERDGIAATKRW